MNKRSVPRSFPSSFSACPSARDSSSFSFTSIYALVGAILLFGGPFSSLLLPGAFAQGSKRQSAYDSVQEKDKDRPDLRDRWMMRGRTAPAGQSPAALRLRAHQQKMAMRAAAARAQAPASLGTAPVAPWSALGPTPLLTDQNYYGAVSGRVTAVAIDPADATGNTVYVAGASGGVWKSTNATAVPATTVTWTPLTDQQASLVNGAVSVKPDGSVVLVGTGEPNSAIDSYYGVGILRSTDHGNTWTLIPAATGNNPALSFAGLGFAKFAWNAAITTTVVAATGTTAKGYGEGDITSNTSRGLYLSTDSGATWTYQTLMDGGNAIAPISATDVVYDAVAGKFMASVRYHGLYSSTNGTNWTRMTSQPTPLSTLNCPPVAASTCPLYRGQLAVVPGRDEVYFWFVSIDPFNNVVDQGIWRSLNGGNSWARIDETGLTNCGDPGNNGCGAEQGYYNLEIAAVPDGQATDLYAGAVNLFKCQLINSRTTCLTLDPSYPNQWINLTHVYGCSSIASVHPDEHGLDFMPVSGTLVMYFGNDGGVYRTLDGFTLLNSGSCGIANGFDDLNASTVPSGTIGSMTQFVSFAIHPTDQETMVGGTQDNGSPATSSAIGTAQWTTVNGGDGGYSAINTDSHWPPIAWYTSNPFVNIYMCPYLVGVDCTTGTFSLTVGSGEVGGDVGAFYTPYILDPQDPYEMLVGTCRVWRGAPTVPPSPFTAMSVDFDTGNSNTCTGEEINLVSGLDAGGPQANFLSTTVYATTEGTGPNAMAPSGGEVWVTTNAGITPMAQVTGTINPSHYTISSVAMDRNDLSGATVYVGIMGFNVSHVFKSTNAGGTWIDWSGSGNNALPPAPVNALLVDGTTIYAGTDVGVFMSSTTNASWTEVDPPPGASGYLPNVPVSAIRMFNFGGTKKLRVSTYGRGIWEYPLAIAPDYTNVISNTPQTVVANQNATFNGILTAIDGYGSPVNFNPSCSGNAPPTCQVSPTQVTPTAMGAPYTVQAAGPAGDYIFNVHAAGTDSQRIPHDAAITLHVVDLNDFDLTAPNPNALTVAQGQTSDAGSVQISASGSFSETVILSCPSGLPTGAACVFSPSSMVNPTVGKPVTVFLTVTAAPTTPVGGPTTVTLAATVVGTSSPKNRTFTLTVVASGTDFTWTDTGNTASTVQAGQSAIYSFSAAPLESATFTSTVSFACANLPKLSSCTFSPRSIAVGAGTTPVTLTIATTGPYVANGVRAALNSGEKPKPTGASDPPGFGVSLVALLTIPLAGIWFSAIEERTRYRKGLVALGWPAILWLLLLVACGGLSGGGNSGGPPPPPGNATVTVTPGSGSLYEDQPGNTWPAAATQLQFSATVNNGTSQAVTWAVTGGQANGTINANGLYTAPPLAPNPSSVTVTATSTLAPVPGSARVTIQSATTVGTANVQVTATASGGATHTDVVSLTVD